MYIANSLVYLQWIERPVKDTVIRYASSHGTRVSFKKGTIIIPEGSVAEHAYVVIKGWAAYYLNNLCGEERIASLVGPRRIFGLGPAFDQLPVSGSIQAIEDCEAYKVSRKDLIQAMLEDINLGIEMVSIVTLRLRSILEGENIFSSLTTPNQRLIYYFVSLLQSGEQKKHGNGDWYELPVNLSHERIGEIISASRSTVCRMISKYKHTGKLKTVRNRLFIHRGLVEEYGVIEMDDRQPKLCDGCIPNSM